MDVISYGGGLQLNALFTAISAFTDTPDYLSAIGVMLSISIIVIALESAFTGTLAPSARILIAVFFINVALFSRGDANIIDRVEPANSTTVANVPAGVLVVSSIASQTSDWFTEQFETIFSMPDGLKYRNNGLLFANRLVQASTEFEIADPVFARNMSQFIRSCVFFGANVGWFQWEELFAADNVWAYIMAEGTGGAIYTSYQAPETDEVTLQPCSVVQVALDQRWNDSIQSTADVFGLRIFGGEYTSVANAKLLAALPGAYNYLTTVSATGAEIVQQNTIVNAMRRAHRSMAADANATAVLQDYALAHAEAQQRATYRTLGALAARTLPLIKNVLEMLIYGLFPMIVLIVIVTMYPGKFTLFYVKAMIWLHLWAPLYAVLHFAMSVHSSGDLASVANIPASIGTLDSGAAISVMTQGGIRSVNASMAEMAGYLAWLIPGMSWGLVSAGGYAMSQVASSIGSVAQSSGSAGASTASSGNISLGNTSQNNSNIFAKSSVPIENTGAGSRVDPQTGATMTTPTGGGSFQKTLRHGTGLAANLSQSVQSSLQSKASSSMSAAQQDVKQFANAFASNFSDMMSYSHDVSTGLSTSDSNGYKFDASINEQAGRIRSGAQQLAEKHDIGFDSALKAAVFAGAGVKIPLTELGIRGEVARTGSAKNSALLSDLQQFSEETKLSDTSQNVLSASEQFASQTAAKIGHSDSQRVAAALQSTLSAQSTASASLSEAKSFEQAAAQIQQNGFSGSQDAVAAIRSDLQYRDKGGTSFGSSSPVWTNSDINQLFAQADAGNKGAISTLNQVVGDFSNRYAGELASGASDVQTFHGQASSSIGGSDAVSNLDQANRRTVGLNAARVDSDLPGQETAVKSDAISAASAVETIKEATQDSKRDAEIALDSQGQGQRDKYKNYKEANVQGTLDPSLPDWTSDIK